MKDALFYDAIVIGAGAAGLMCAAVASHGGKRVALIDHSEKIAEKIRISGGGRCNFTNREVGYENMVGENPRFARYALTEYTPKHFIDLVKRHRIAFHEKHKGQLFCDDSAEDIIEMLLAECAQGGVQWFRPCKVDSVLKRGEHYQVNLEAAQALQTPHLVIATGGLSIPKIGATDFGYRIARQFDLPVVATRPALVPLTFDAQQWQTFAGLSGLSLPVQARAIGEKNSTVFNEDLLFTHRGLSGPAILQISSFWQAGQAIELDLSGGQALDTELTQSKLGNKQQFATVLGQYLPKRLVEGWLAAEGLDTLAAQKYADTPDKTIKALAQGLMRWQLQPTGSEGYKKAEVTRGGVDTRHLCQKSMQSKVHSGLYFIGEVVDITGWLGGYNFQWAWASAHAAGKAISSSPPSAA
ncbi:MAG: NAD(P)/FAD-dependent oxidoreductase [Burkholderiales bacterium]|nr:NAD(P)/FAD-dependent oxidoreductase [Burkholderiales bacterium]